MAALMRTFSVILLLFSVMAGSSPGNKESLREAFLQKKWQEADQKSQSLLSEANTDSAKDLFRLTQAIALERQSKHEESIKLLEEINEQSLYYTWSRIFMTRLAFQTKNISLLKKNIEAMGKINLKGELKTEKQFYEAHLLMDSRKWTPAAKQLQLIEKSGLRGDFPIQVLESLIVAQFEAKKFPLACKNLIKMYRKYPTHPWISDKAPELKQIPVGSGELSCVVQGKDFDARRKTLNIMGEHKRANDELNKWFLLAKIGSKEKVILQAQQQIAEGFVDEGLAKLQSAKESDADLQVLIPLSFAAAKAGDLKLAIDTSMAVYKVAGNSKTGVSALYQAGVWAYQIRDYQNAENRLRKVPVVRLSSAYRKELKWYLGWLRYLKGDYVGAERSFRMMLNPFSRKRVKENPDRIQYWLAMSLLKQGKNEKSRIIFEKLKGRSRLAFYSLLAQERLSQINAKSERKPAKVDEQINLTIAGRSANLTPFGERAPWPNEQEAAMTEEVVEGGETTDEAALLAEEQVNEESEEEKTAEVAPGTGADIFSQTEANQKLERAKAFWSVGLEDLARREVGDLEKYSRGFELFKKVIEEYRVMGLYHKLTVMGSSYSHRANMTSNKFIYEAMYPKAYAEQVEKQAEEFDIPPALIWSIMKAESMFKPWARSPVGALGLMQVMPTTGQKLAEMMSVKDFSAESLLEPAQAIRFGSRYLERLSRKFEYSIPLVAAAYNAGPHRVSQWLYYFGLMQMDEWVEHIPFVETRNYVKKVSVNYMAYNEIYGKKLGDPITLIDAVPVQVAGRPETKESWD